VCQAEFRFPKRRSLQKITSKISLWFSLRAQDRLDAYTRAWWQSLVHVFAAERREAARTRTRPTVAGALARSGSAKQLAAVLATAEACVWASRELKRAGEAGRLSGEARMIRAVAMFASIVSVATRLKEFSSKGIVVEA
jgi:hypothetical protein